MAANGQRFQPSFKELSFSVPNDFVKQTRRKIRTAIRQVSAGLATGEVNPDIPAHLFFSLKADKSTKIVRMLRYAGGADDIPVYKSLFQSKFDRVFFEARDGVFELDLISGKAQKVIP